VVGPAILLELANVEAPETAFSQRMMKWRDLRAPVITCMAAFAGSAFTSPVLASPDPVITSMIP
jgi:hypothetical protein